MICVVEMKAIKHIFAFEKHLSTSLKTVTYNTATYWIKNGYTHKTNSWIIRTRPNVWGLRVCVCVCVCARARARKRACVLAVYNKAQVQRISNREFKLYTFL